MVFTETELKGSYIIEVVPYEDYRGSFTRTFCKREFLQKSLNGTYVQNNTSYSREKGTLRGMHHQTGQYKEAKLIRCTKGSIYDVIIDLRPNSKTFKKWFSVELNENNRKMIYVPEDFAHGFITLEDHVEVLYQMSQYYEPEHSATIRWDDPAFRIQWPNEVAVISERDSKAPDFLK